MPERVKIEKLGNYEVGEGGVALHLIIGCLPNNIQRILCQGLAAECGAESTLYRGFPVYFNFKTDNEITLSSV